MLLRHHSLVQHRRRCLPRFSAREGIPAHVVGARSTSAVSTQFPKSTMLKHTTLPLLHSKLMGIVNGDTMARRRKKTNDHQLDLFAAAPV